MTPRNTGRKIAFGFSAASFVGMAASLVIFINFLATRGVRDVMTASLLAITLFFLSCGVVLYLVSKPPRFKLEPWDSVDQPE
jgi:predicted membrane channel-forming protein YqfA (hemolysin III family)